jgi:hypothetical protein
MLENLTSPPGQLDLVSIHLIKQIKSIELSEELTSFSMAAPFPFHFDRTYSFRILNGQSLHQGCSTTIALLIAGICSESRLTRLLLQG